MAIRTIARLYDSYDDAVSAVRELETAGVPADNISLVAHDLHDRSHTTERKGNESAPGAEIGAGAGAVAGGAAGVLAGLGMLAIPGIGPVVAAGWLVALAAGAAAGAAAGGLLGALVGAGIPREHAEVYAEGVRRGGVVVSVRAPDDLAMRVENILDRHGSVDVEARRRDYAASGWTSHDLNAPAYKREDVERYRAGGRL